MEISLDDEVASPVEQHNIQQLSLCEVPDVGILDVYANQSER
jgi:hypothetical protein